MSTNYCIEWVLVAILLFGSTSATDDAGAIKCAGNAPAPVFICEGLNWVCRGDFNYEGLDGLVFGGSTIIEGNFTFKSSSKNFITFAYNSFVRAKGHAEFDDKASWKIILTPSEARDLWKQQHDRNVTYMQAKTLKYNSNNVRTISSDSCTRIGGRVKTVNVTELGVTSQQMLVEFTEFHSYATCKKWWVIPVVIILVTSIIAVALCCYLKGRSKKAEMEGYIGTSSEPIASLLESEDQLNPMNGHINS